jgi:hypothetical protein
MNSEDIKKKFIESIFVRRQHIVIAKSFILNKIHASKKENSLELILEFLKQEGIEIPDSVRIRAKDDIDKLVSQISESLSLELACVQAIWELVNNTVLMPSINNYERLRHSIKWNWDSDFRSGSEVVTIDGLTTLLPNSIELAPSHKYEFKYQPLSDADLYIQELGIPNLDAEIEAALRESINCFKNELFTAAVAMLGKASEGAWQELGMSLVSILPKEEKQLSEKMRDILTNQNTSMHRRIQKVAELYKNKSLFKTLIAESGVNPSYLDDVVIWSNNVRESRNEVHYQVNASLPNSYEKVASLLLGAARYLNILYQIKNTALRLNDPNPSA